MRSVKSFDGTGLALCDEGPSHGRPVLLAHSLGATYAIWDEIAAGLVDKGFRVLRADGRGHGASDAPEGPYSVEDIGRDLIALLDAAAAPKAHIVGLSMGGMAAMWLAVHAPERVDRLVLANTTAFIPVKDRWDQMIAQSRQQGMAPIAEPTILSWLSPGFRERNPARTAALVATMRAMPPHGYAGCCAILRDVDLRGSLGSIAAPTLVVNGKDDERGAAASAALTAGIAGARRVDIPDAAHLSPTENPRALLSALLKHFE